MRFRNVLLPLAIAAAPVALAQAGWQRYANAGLSAEFPAEPDRFDKWTDIAKGRVIQMDRFVRNEPLRRVHECVFGVLALESEPVDPRL